MVQGGAIPRRLRRTLAVILIAKHFDVVATPFPGFKGRRF
jgi:hypothetical protein